MNERLLPVVHLVNAMSGGTNELWGKERVIANLMRAQAASGRIGPRLLTFAPCRLGDLLSGEGFSVAVLDTRDRLLSLRAFSALRRQLVFDGPPMLHTHGYKANIIGRTARAAGIPMRGLISTCHGWVDETLRTRLYNHVDRATAFASDVVTVTDQKMLSYFSRRVRSTYVANGIEERELPSPAQRRAARAYFHLPSDRVLLGVLGRIDAAKGVLDVLEAARRTRDIPVQWLIAGSGMLESTVTESGLPNITMLGYVRQNELYLDALDVYLQASHTEGLSLALLEAMRAGLPIIATEVGSTSLAVRHMREAVLVPPGDVDAIVSAVRKSASDPAFTSQLGAAARQRFETSYQITHQHQAFLDIYESCDRSCA